jgi:peptidoglycan/LPS O-acetylase OafA/YrhL
VALSIDSPWGYLLCMIVMCGFAHALATRVPFFAETAPRSTAPLGNAIDGFRGFLASGVFIHHAVIRYVYSKTAVWTCPPSHFYVFLGSDCVRIFFMITGVLFWTKCIHANARIDTRPLLVSRVRRVLPMYFASMSIVLVLAFEQSRFALVEPPARIFVEVLPWLGGGLLKPPNVNGTTTWHINSGVTWTLQYEWGFYLLLPLVAWFATPRRFGLLTLLFLGAFVLTRFTGTFFSFALAARFWSGMAIAQIVASFREPRHVKAPVISALVLACLVVAGFMPAPVWITHILVAVALLAIVYGNDIFGLLTRRSSLLLGQISYSIYLLHGIVLYLYIRAARDVSSLQASWSVHFWIVMIPLCITVVSISALTYRYIEYPALRGKSPRRASLGENHSGANAELASAVDRKVTVTPGPADHRA